MELDRKSETVAYYASETITDGFVSGEVLGEPVDTQFFGSATMVHEFIPEAGGIFINSYGFEETSDDPGGTPVWTDVPDDSVLIEPGLLPLSSEDTPNLLFSVGCLAKQRWIRSKYFVTGDTSQFITTIFLQCPLVSPMNPGESVLAAATSPGPVGDTQSTPPKRPI